MVMPAVRPWTPKFKVWPAFPCFPSSREAWLAISDPREMPSTTGMEKTGEDDTKDRGSCRICFDEEASDFPLVAPCRCSGSILYVHQGCLARWVFPRRATRCEVCHHKYRTCRKKRHISRAELVRLFRQQLWRTLRAVLTTLRLTTETVLWSFGFTSCLLFICRGVDFVASHLIAPEHALPFWFLGPASAFTYVFVTLFVAEEICLTTCATQHVVRSSLLSSATALCFPLLRGVMEHCARNGRLPTLEWLARLPFLPGWHVHHVVQLFTGLHLAWEVAYLLFFVTRRVLRCRYTLAFEDFAPDQ